jgi:hypothetical protein
MGVHPSPIERDDSSLNGGRNDEKQFKIPCLSG